MKSNPICNEIHNNCTLILFTWIFGHLYVAFQMSMLLVIMYVSQESLESWGGHVKRRKLRVNVEKRKVMKVYKKI